MPVIPFESSFSLLIARCPECKPGIIAAHGEDGQSDLIADDRFSTISAGHVQRISKRPFKTCSKTLKRHPKARRPNRSDATASKRVGLSIQPDLSAAREPRAPDCCSDPLPP